MPPTESFIQLQTDGTGKFLRTVTQSISAQTEHMEVQVIGDPTTTANLLAIDASGNITVNVNGSVTVSGTVTANAGSNLNTSALALETGGNLATLAGGVSSSLYQINVSKVAGATATAGDINNAAGITGSQDVAPVARYNATQPTLTDTRYNLLQVSQRGELLVTPGATGFAISFSAPQHVILDSGALSANQSVNVAQVNAHTVNEAASGTQLVGIADGTGNALTSNSTTYTAKKALDANLLGVLGTAFTTAGFIDIKGADGNVFVRQTSAANLLATVTQTSGNWNENIAQVNAHTVNEAASGTILVGIADGAGSKLTTNSTTYTAKIALDSNLLGTLGTAFSTAGKVDIKAADGDVFVRSNAASTFPVNVGTWIGSNAPTVGQKAMVNSLPVVLASDQTSIPVAATLTAETTKVIGTIRITGNIGGVMDAAGQNAVSPANELLIAGQFNTTPTTISSGNVSPLQLDSAGNLLVNIKAGSSGNAAASATGSAIPSSADYQGVNVGGTLRGWTGVNPSGVVYAAQTDVTSVNGVTVTGMVAGSVPVTIVSGAGSGGTASQDSSIFTLAASNGTPAMGLLNDATPNLVSDLDVGVFRMSANRNQYIQIRDGLGGEIGPTVGLTYGLRVESPDLKDVMRVMIAEIRAVRKSILGVAEVQTQLQIMGNAALASTGASSLIQTLQMEEFEVDAPTEFATFEKS